MEAAEFAALEALADARIGPVSSEELAAELARHFPGTAVDPGSLGAAHAEDLDEARRSRPIEWATLTTSQGEILDAFAAHCRKELDDVEVLEETPVRLELGCRRERSRLELRAGFLFLERLAANGPALLLGELGPAVVERFLADESLRSRLAVYDLARLEKVNAVRSSVFVYFEWFLRDRYGVKLLPCGAFTQGLVDRGIIHLGMG